MSCVASSNLGSYVSGGSCYLSSTGGNFEGAPLKEIDQVLAEMENTQVIGTQSDELYGQVYEL